MMCECDARAAAAASGVNDVGRHAVTVHDACKKAGIRTWSKQPAERYRYAQQSCCWPMSGLSARCAQPERQRRVLHRHEVRLSGLTGSPQLALALSVGKRLVELLQLRLGQLVAVFGAAAAAAALLLLLLLWLLLRMLLLAGLLAALALLMALLLLLRLLVLLVGRLLLRLRRHGAAVAVGVQVLHGPGLHILPAGVRRQQGCSGSRSISQLQLWCIREGTSQHQSQCICCSHSQKERQPDRSSRRAADGDCFSRPSFMSICMPVFQSVSTRSDQGPRASYHSGHACPPSTSSTGANSMPLLWTLCST